MGASVELPDWREQSQMPIVVGQPPRIALLRPLEDGRYRVELVLK
jgi:hypothetical protein